MIPERQTERLLLRGFEPGDLDAFAAISADSEVMRYIGPGGTVDRAAAWWSMAMQIGHWRLRGYGQWAVIEQRSGELVGRAGLYRPEGWPGLEVGWMLGRRSWGRGFATEAGAASIEFAFDVIGADEVISLIHPDNTASIRVAERLGERYQRTMEVAGREALVYVLARSDHR
ncbi:MAG TPA: GNAT family N-acetyltransferase [Solirubrobacteraceae bacterium]|nr:GNAT family N-acetyltransferase [Solirubrobacteraceae bacterium]